MVDFITVIVAAIVGAISSDADPYRDSDGRYQTHKRAFINWVIMVIFAIIVETLFVSNYRNDLGIGGAILLTLVAYWAYIKWVDPR